MNGGGGGRRGIGWETATGIIWKSTWLTEREWVVPGFGLVPGNVLTRLNIDLMI